MKDLFIRGFGISGYRSFDFGPIERIGPMSRIHLLAGPNNSGKSNAMKAASLILPAIRNSTEYAPGDVDAPQVSRGGHPAVPRFALCMSVDRPKLFEDASGQIKRLVDEVWPWMRETSLCPGGGDDIWWEFELKEHRWHRSVDQAAELFGHAQAVGKEHTLAGLSDLLTNDRGGGPSANAERFLEWLYRASDIPARLPDVESIAAFRKIGDPSGDAGEFDGPGLVARLAALQNPELGHDEDAEKFGLINRFVGELFEDDETRIEIPNSQSEILVRHGGRRRLPLSSYGSGMHQTVILAAAATVLEKTLIFVEEPEVNLHPSLQRRLLGYLSEVGSNQYVIATHSPQLLDMAKASISAVSMRHGHSEIESTTQSSEIARLSAELGLRASDLVQSNSVIWVEGPSDRVYLRAWIHSVDPELQEGIHYSIMFYGGSLLSHLGPTDPSVEDFISLPRINRNFSIVIDSDRRKKGQRINGTKSRVKSEIEESSDGIAWVTKGYTIENYVPAARLVKAVKKVHPSVDLRWSGGAYANPLATAELPRSSSLDKTAVAREVVSSWAGNDLAEWPLDLHKEVKRVVRFIREANDLDPDLETGASGARARGG